MRYNRNRRGLLQAAGESTAAKQVDALRMIRDKVGGEFRNQRFDLVTHLAAPRMARPALQLNIHRCQVLVEGKAEQRPEPLEELVRVRGDQRFGALALARSPAWRGGLRFQGGLRHASLHRVVAYQGSQRRL